MRSTRLLLAVLLAPCALSCGKSKPDAAPEAKNKATNPVIAPAGPGELRGRWKSVDARRPVLGEFLNPDGKQADTSVVVSIRKHHIDIKDGAGLGTVLDYKPLDDGRLELTHVVVVPPPPPSIDLDDKDKEKEPEKPVEKKKVKVVKAQYSASELTLSDDSGKTERFVRLPVESATIKIDGLAFYADPCADQVKQALADVRGLSDLAVDRSKKQVTLKLKDKEDRDEVQAAIEQAGMHGAIEVNGKPTAEFSPAGRTLDGSKAKPVSQLVLKNIHACCPQCRQAIMDLVPGGAVKFAGDGPTTTATITGAALERDKIVLSLWRAGFRIDDR